MLGWWLEEMFYHAVSVLLGCIMLATYEVVKHQTLTHLQRVLMDKSATDKLLAGSCSLITLDCI